MEIPCKLYRLCNGNHAPRSPSSFRGRIDREDNTHGPRSPQSLQLGGRLNRIDCPHRHFTSGDSCNCSGQLPQCSRSGKCCNLAVVEDASVCAEGIRQPGDGYALPCAPLRSVSTNRTLRSTPRTIPCAPALHQQASDAVARSPLLWQQPERCQRPSRGTHVQPVSVQSRTKPPPASRG